MQNGNLSGHTGGDMPGLRAGDGPSDQDNLRSFPPQRRSGQGIIAVLEGTSRQRPLRDHLLSGGMPGMDPMMGMDPMAGAGMMGMMPPMGGGMDPNMMGGGMDPNMMGMMGQMAGAGAMGGANGGFGMPPLGMPPTGMPPTGMPPTGMPGVDDDDMPSAGEAGSAPSAMPSAIMAAMMMPIVDAPGLDPSQGPGPCAMDLMQMGATDPKGAAEIINNLMGPDTCDESTVQAAAMQVAMRQSYTFAANMAKGMGYYSLEHYELHRQSMVKAQSQRGKKGMVEKKLTLFVGGLKKETTESTVRNHFAQYGDVTRADVIRNTDGTSRGFAFVNFATDEEVYKCMEYKFDHILDGQWVNCKVSDPNRQDAGKNASRAVEIAAMNAGVEPSKYLDYLTDVCRAKYGYGSNHVEDNVSRDRHKPY